MPTDMIILKKDGIKQAEIPFLEYICMDCFQRQALMEIQFGLGRNWSIEEVEVFSPTLIPSYHF